MDLLGLGCERLQEPGTWCHHGELALGPGVALHSGGQAAARSHRRAGGVAQEVLQQGCRSSCSLADGWGTGSTLGCRLATIAERKSATAERWKLSQI
eukprot:16441861-Heterocapsa_arctica.AAC.1